MSQDNKRTKKEIHDQVNLLISKMTIEEKVGQLYQTAIMGEFDYGPAFEKNNLSVLIKEGRLGSMVGPYDNKVSEKLQKIAVEQSRLGIPLMFCNDIIHGCRTGFPVNLAMSGSFNPELVKESAEVIAFEASHSGTHVTFAPMLDIVRDPRWGRVVESPGEDPYLASVMAKSWVEGFQGSDCSDGNHVGSCAKHFVAYGAAEAGREYNTVDMSERMLRQIYLKPFHQAVQSGAKMVMSAFNVYDGIPITSNKFLLKNVLRDEMGFKGVTVSDYTSTEELLNHKTARDKKDVAFKCLDATMDIELIATSYSKYLPELSKEYPSIQKSIDEAVYRVLTLKYELGLFDRPYSNIHPDFEKYFLLPNHLEVAKKMAIESIVMLENNGVLPIEKTKNIALIGPFSTTNRLVGPWGGKARNEDCISVYDGLSKLYPNLLNAEGSTLKTIDENMINEAMIVASKSDVILLALGEDQYESGEANSKSFIGISDAQIELVKKLHELNKPMVAVIFSGRPLILTPLIPYVDALLYAWFLGTETGNALADIISGKENPSARLAMTFPYSQGQIPIYYNHMRTGRPLDDINHPKNHYTSRYIDIKNQPLYPFGYGLSYSQFTYDHFNVSQDILEDQGFEVSFEITNQSDQDGAEVVQLYIEALYFSVTRPVNELKKFKKIWIRAHETEHVSFNLNFDDFRYYGYPMVNTTESAEYYIKIGLHAEKMIFTKKIQINER
ncbi:MAG: glycoside hydrolase family 3 C-terminal domain-containing protein [Firmicutes bacterium]|nr:glycoside hydrolase family 3 C-terminal domain-containing protein [Bacillota bacterium]